MSNELISIPFTRRQWVRIINWYRNYYFQDWDDHVDEILAKRIMETIKYDPLEEYEQEG
jgi:hypothetical protein